MLNETNTQKLQRFLAAYEADLKMYQDALALAESIFGKVSCEYAATKQQLAACKKRIHELTAELRFTQ